MTSWRRRFWLPDAFGGWKPLCEKWLALLMRGVGYTGGNLANATYEQVCAGSSGHAEAVEVLFAPARVSFGQLLGVFWQLHDPTQLNQQGADVGSQYRSAIFYTTESQKQTAEESLAKEQQKHNRTIATQICPLGEFWLAEDYHQNYVQKRRGRLYSELAMRRAILMAQLAGDMRRSAGRGCGF